MAVNRYLLLGNSAVRICKFKSDVKYVPCVDVMWLKALVLFPFALCHQPQKETKPKSPLVHMGELYSPSEKRDPH